MQPYVMTKKRQTPLKSDAFFKFYISFSIG